MAPKKVTDVEKPKRKIIMTTVELEKELITKWEKGFGPGRSIRYG
jgi:hypothetical protein